MVAKAKNYILEQTTNLNWIVELMTIDMVEMISILANIATIIGFGISIYTLKANIDKKISNIYATFNQNGSVINYQIIGNPTINNVSTVDNATEQRNVVKK